MSNRFRWVSVGFLAVVVGGGVYARAEEEQKQTNWPLVIAELRHDVQSKPGLAFPRQQLAIALNNYGVTLSEEGQWGLAKEQLTEALKLDATNKQFSKNLAGVYLSEAYHEREALRNKEARAALEQAIALDPELARAYVLLGDIEYDSQQLAKAKTAWQNAVALDPTLTALAERLKQLNQELPVESKFERLPQAYFDLRYEEQLQGPVGFDIRDTLLEARSRVGSDFAYWPKYKIVVLIYGDESFRILRKETPDWVGGQYDGKIRVPLPGAQTDAATVKQILFHEYTHALVHELARGKCPVWFNEGLAEYEGMKHGHRRLEQLTAAAAHNRLIAWEQLDEQFSASLPFDQVALGYQESSSVIHYLVERYGFWRIRRILTALADGGTLSDVLDQEFHLKPGRLEAAWREWLPNFIR